MMQNQDMWLKQQNCLKVLVDLNLTKKSYYADLIQSHLPDKTSVGGSKICFTLFNCLFLETLHGKGCNLCLYICLQG